MLIHFWSYIILKKAIRKSQNSRNQGCFMFLLVDGRIRIRIRTNKLRIRMRIQVAQNELIQMRNLVLKPAYFQIPVFDFLSAARMTAGSLERSDRRLNLSMVSMFTHPSLAFRESWTQGKQSSCISLSIWSRSSRIASALKVSTQTPTVRFSGGAKTHEWA